MCNVFEALNTTSVECKKKKFTNVQKQTENMLHKIPVNCCPLKN